MNPYTRTVVTSAATAVLVTVVLFLCLPFREDSASTTGGQSVYGRVRSNDTLRAAYAVGAPLFMIDPNTKEKSGIFYDLVEGAAAKLGLEVRWAEEVGYGEMIQGLAANRYDIVGSGVWINGARGKDADFTIPVYYDAVLAYVRQGDTRFDDDLSILDSPSYTISTMDGELGAVIAQTDFPEARKEELPQMADFTQLILNVINKKADVVFLALAPARQYQARNPGMIRPVGTGKPVRVFPVAIMLPKGANELRDSLNYALTEMITSGEVEAILHKYATSAVHFSGSRPPIELNRHRNELIRSALGIPRSVPRWVSNDR